MSRANEPGQALRWLPTSPRVVTPKILGSWYEAGEIREYAAGPGLRAWTLPPNTLRMRVSFCHLKFWLILGLGTPAPAFAAQSWLLACDEHALAV